MSSIRKLTEFFGLRRSIVGMLGVVILVGMGERIGERFLPKYVEILGGGIMAIGLLIALQNLISAGYSVIGASITARFGTKRSLLMFNALSMIGFLIVVLIPTWHAVIIGSIFFLSWSGISLPATMKLVAKALPKNKRTMGVSMQSFIRRIPMALGPLIGGVFIDAWGTKTGVRAAFAVALGIAALAAVVQQVLIEDDRGPAGSGKAPVQESHPFAMIHHFSAPLRNLLISDILVRFCEQMPYGLVVIWCMDVLRSKHAGLEFGTLTAIEMATAMAIYVPVAYLADRSHKKPFVVMTFIFFTLFPYVLIFSQSFWPLVGAFVLRGLKEFGEPTRKALIMDLAPEDHKAAMFGLYYLLRDSIVSISPLIGAALWLYCGSITSLLAAFVFGVIGTTWFALAGRDLGPAKPAAAAQ